MVARALSILATLALAGVAVLNTGAPLGAQTSELVNRLRKQFGFSLPESATLECQHTSADRRVRFVCVRMPPADAARFKEALIEAHRPAGQRFTYEDGKTIARLGSLPAGNEPPGVGVLLLHSGLAAAQNEGPEQACGPGV